MRILRMALAAVLPCGEIPGLRCALSGLRNRKLRRVLDQLRCCGALPRGILGWFKRAPRARKKLGPAE
jgi:hypothetical protein